MRGKVIDTDVCLNDSAKEAERKKEVEIRLSRKKV